MVTELFALNSIKKKPSCLDGQLNCCFTMIFSCSIKYECKLMGHRTEKK